MQMHGRNERSIRATRRCRVRMSVEGRQMSNSTIPPGRDLTFTLPIERNSGPECGSAQVWGSPRVLLDSDIGFVLGSPFYELLTTFTVAYAGLNPIFDSVGYPEFLGEVQGVFQGFVWRQMTTDLGKRVAEVRGGAISHSEAQNALCCMLANSAWERAQPDLKGVDRGRPDVQYFRHVRNAASHGNRWHFSDKSRHREPAKAASWRGSAIDHNLKGSSNPLHDKPCFGSSLGAADVLRSLLDIEPLLKR